jgi:hypothetical protein
VTHAIAPVPLLRQQHPGSNWMLLDVHAQPYACGIGAHHLAVARGTAAAY